MTSVLPSASASREDFVICSICLFCFQVSHFTTTVLTKFFQAGLGRLTLLQTYRLVWRAPQMASGLACLPP
jgi:hypothetical protein